MRVEKLTFKCKQCGCGFMLYQSQVRKKGDGGFCSQECLSEYRRHGSKLFCFTCGKEFYRRFGEQGETKKPFCSIKCYQSWRSGKRTCYKKIGAKHEHRIIAESMLRRPLKRGEIVHHINGDKKDNRIKNLMVLPSQADHAAIHFTKPNNMESLKTAATEQDLFQ